MDAIAGKVKVVWSITERGARTHMTKVGVAWEAEDGTIQARLDAMPLSGRFCIRPWLSPESGEGGGA